MSVAYICDGFFADNIEKEAMTNNVRPAKHAAVLLLWRKNDPEWNHVGA